MFLLIQKVFIGLLVLLFCIYGQAQCQSSFTPKPRQVPYVKDSTSFYGYYQYLPANYESSNQRFPLVVYLPGLESKGDGIQDLNILIEYSLPKMLKEGKQLPALVMAPQSTTGSWKPNEVAEYISFLSRNYRIDTTRVYITGISLGSIGTFLTTTEFPEKITAAAPIGGSTSDLEMCNAVDVPIWAFHTMDDPILDANLAITAINNLNSCNPSPVPPGKITIYPEGGHDAWTKTYDRSGMGTEDAAYDAFNVDVFDWMFLFAKDTILADAGNDQTLFFPENDIQIDAYAASNDGLHTYAWSQLEGPAINLDGQVSSTLNLQDVPSGRYTLLLTVTDNFGKTATDTVKVFIRPPNGPPTVEAGVDQIVAFPIDSVTFTGAATDPEEDAITFVWKQTAGPTEASLQNKGLQLVVKNLAEGKYTFELKATDVYNSAGVDSVHLTVAAPFADAGIIAIQQPDTSLLPFSSQEQITVIIKNFGNVSQNNFQAGYQIGEEAAVLETVAEEIAPGSSITFTFDALADMSLLQNYTLRAFTLLNQDTNPENDTAMVNLNWLPAITNFPYAESFEQMTEASWRTYGNNSSWERGQPMNDIMDAAADGTVAWVTGLQKDYQANEVSFLLSPAFDFSGFTADPVITYDVWQVTAPEDSAQLSFTTDGGATWQSLNLMGDNLLTNEPTGWKTVTHYLEGLAGQQAVLFRIELRANSEDQNEGIAFDNVFICNETPNLLPVPDTLVIAGQTLTLPIEVEAAAPPNITFYAFSDNQALVPNENISIENNNLRIAPLATTEGEVNITVYARALCVNAISFKITVAKVTGTVEEEEDAMVKVYPNPGTGLYQVEMKPDIQSVKLYNQEGRHMKDFIIKTLTGKSISIDITSYSSGLYYLHIETSAGKTVHKLIKH